MNEDKKKITQEFFRKLYSQENIPEDITKQYLEKAGLTKITDTTRIMLERIMTMEITEAIKRQKNNNTPGPDGLPAELYKNLQESLGSSLLEVYNNALLRAKLLKTWTEAHITLIPKEDRSPTDKNITIKC
uniref:Reverse transcriptase domain-containing protein n=1 Tax=Micrurus spixii TaxID=129469 RepID=A0A2D4MQX7_9SAUR